MDALPDDEVRGRPSLCAFHAWALLLSGRPLQAAGTIIRLSTRFDAIPFFGKIDLMRIPEDWIGKQITFQLTGWIKGRQLLNFIRHGNLGRIKAGRIFLPNRHRNGGFGAAIHAGQEAWETVYGTELAHLEEVKRRLEREE